MQEMNLTEVAQVNGADAYTNLALVGGTVAAAVGGAFIVPAVAGASFFAGLAYLGGFGVGSIYHYYVSNRK